MIEMAQVRELLMDEGASYGERKMARRYLLVVGELRARRAGKYWPRPNFIRAGGDAVCQYCGLAYYDHLDVPRDDDPAGLTVLCAGLRVKL